MSNILRLTFKSPIRRVLYSHIRTIWRPDGESYSVEIIGYQCDVDRLINSKFLLTQIPLIEFGSMRNLEIMN